MIDINLEKVSITITKGTTPTTVGGKFTDEGINFVKSDSVGQYKHLDNKLFQFIDEKTDEKLKRSRLKEDDLLFSIAGAYLGKLSIVKKDDLPANTNQAVGIVRLNKEKADVNYLYYYFSQKNINEYINKLSSQSSQPNLNLGLLGNLKFKNRNLSIQKQIAKVLSGLDSKIEVNNKINQELEAMAKTLYDYWFVQFDFPDTNGKPYKSSGGKMVFNEELKREIPEGWEDAKLDDLSTRIGDGLHGTPKYVDASEFSFINGNNLKDGFIATNNETRKVSKDEYEKHFIELNDNSILLSINGTLGNLAIYNNEKVMLGKSSAYINCKENYRTYCYEYLNQNHMPKVFWNLATGSTIKNLGLSSIKNLKILKPNIDLIEKFSNATNPIVNKRKNIFKENQKLAELRDWLLPMLMNGQVSVGDATQEVESLGLVTEENVKYGRE